MHFFRLNAIQSPFKKLASLQNHFNNETALLFFAWIGIIIQFLLAWMSTLKPISKTQSVKKGNEHSKETTDIIKENRYEQKHLGTRENFQKIGKKWKKSRSPMRF